MTSIITDRLHVDIATVSVTVGNSLKAQAGRTARLGTLAIRYLVDGYIVKSAQLDILVDLKDLSSKLSIPFVRNDWEQALRITLSTQPTFKQLIDEEGRITDIFVKRLNVTNRLYGLGWANNSVDMRSKVIEVYQVPANLLS